MKGDGLEADQILAAGHGTRDGRGPAIVLGNHLASTPLAISHGTRQEASLVDLEL